MPLSWLPRCCARSMQKHRKCSSGSQTTPQGKRRKGALLTPGPPQTAATNLLQSLDVLRLPHQHLPNKRHLRLESLKIKSSEGFFHCQFREFSQNTEHTDSCNADLLHFISLTVFNHLWSSIWKLLFTHTTGTRLQGKMNFTGLPGFVCGHHLTYYQIKTSRPT